jgi:uncharacterized protein
MNSPETVFGGKTMGIEANSPDPAFPEIAPSSELSVDLEFSALEKPVLLPRLWGPWATIGWTLLCIMTLFAAQIAGAIIFVLCRSAITGSLTFDDLGTNGNLLALATLFSTLATVGLIALLVWLRGYPIRDYLALYWPSTRSVLIALAGLTVLLVATDVTSYTLRKPIVPTFMVDVYRSAWLPALLLALVVLAPAGEETLFRGFLYRGLAASRGGPTLAIIITSAAFAMLHAFQYDWYAIGGVAAMGFYLGFVRYRSGSLFLTMLLHAVANAFATLELVVQETWLK